MVNPNQEWIECVCVAAQEGDKRSKRRTLISSYMLAVTVWGGSRDGVGAFRAEIPGKYTLFK